MKQFKLIVFLLLLVVAVYAQNNIATYKPSPENLAQREKFQDLKYGLFVHWGIYSVLGDGEWVMHQRKIPYNSYKRLADFFNPQQFDAKE